MLSKRQMHQNKRKQPYKQILFKKDVPKCAKVYTKQIGICLDNLVLAKQVPQLMKTLSKRNTV
jgi:hypothetical protein